MGLLGMCDVGGCAMLGMCDVGDVRCWGCAMLGMWDVGHVGCSGCGMFGMWDVRDVGYSGCGMFGMWDVRDVGCGMFAGMLDVDLQNADNVVYGYFPAKRRLCVEAAVHICFSEVFLRISYYSQENTCVGVSL